LIVSCLTKFSSPPGCGKTTLISTIVQRYIQQEHPKRQRVFVSAPTNRALGVLTIRCIQKVEAISPYQEPRIVIVSQGIRNEDLALLNRYFLSSWMTVLRNQYSTLARNVYERLTSHADALFWAHKLWTRMERNLEQPLPPTLTKSAKTIIHLIETQEPEDWRDQVVKHKDALTKALDLMDARAVTMSLLNKAQIIFGTLCGMGSPLVRGSLDAHDVIIDEAAASTESAATIALHTNPKRVLLVGDPKQLPAVVMSDTAAKLGHSISLQERLMVECKHPYLMLNRQYRMHPAISEFPSQTFYDGRLRDGASVQQPRTVGNVLRPYRPYILCQVNGDPSSNNPQSQSVCNPQEAQVVAQLVECLAQRSTTWYSTDQLRIITFYSSQVVAIRRLLSRKYPKVSVATVDSSQGCESDVVILSFVRGKGTAGFLTDNRRLNVALTRARHQLICVANASAMQVLTKAPNVKALALDASERRVVETIEEIMQKHG